MQFCRSQGKLKVNQEMSRRGQHRAPAQWQLPGYVQQLRQVKLPFSQGQVHPVAVIMFKLPKELGVKPHIPMHICKCAAQGM